MALKRTLLIALFFLSVVAVTSHASAVPLPTETGKQAVFLSPLERWMPTWNPEWYVSQLERAGYHVDILLNEDVSIPFLKTGLAKYDVIILRTDSFDNEGSTFYCSGEPATAKARTAFTAEISSGEVQVAACVGFSRTFLEDNYPANSLRQGLVYVVGGLTAELSSAFLAGGSSAFIGYDDFVSLPWGKIDALSIRLLGYLSEGYAVKAALTQLSGYLHTGHGETADWVLPHCTGNGDFKI